MAELGSVNIRLQRNYPTVAQACGLFDADIERIHDMTLLLSFDASGFACPNFERGVVKHQTKRAHQLTGLRRKKWIVWKWTSKLLTLHAAIEVRHFCLLKLLWANITVTRQALEKNGCLFYHADVKYLWAFVLKSLRRPFSTFPCHFTSQSGVFDVPPYQFEALKHCRSK